MSETKLCSRGDHFVSRDKFSKSSTTPDGLFRWCKSCMASYERERYANGDKARKARNREKILARNREYIWAYLLENPCDCGVRDPRVLHFDHIDATTKRFNVSEMFWNYSIALIQEEIEKCVVRCSNCHIIRTNEQFGYWKMQRTDQVDA